MWVLIEFIINILTFSDPRKLMRGEPEEDNSGPKQNDN